jgi:hypothetical protein
MITISAILLRVCMSLTSAWCYYVPVNHPTMDACIAQGKLETAGKPGSSYKCNTMPILVVSATGTLPCADCLTAH